MKGPRKALLVAAAFAFVPLLAVAEQLTFNNTITGDPFDLSNAAGADTPAAKQFLATGVNPYIEVPGCLKIGEQTFLASCSGCHGHVGEGKLGPGLNDDYYTYPKNETDKGMFETIWGGARSMMGPHQDLGVDEILKVIAWIRHIYKGPVENAVWLNAEQKKTYEPYESTTPYEGDGKCEIPAS